MWKIYTDTAELASGTVALAYSFSGVPTLLLATEIATRSFKKRVNLVSYAGDLTSAFFFCAEQMDSPIYENRKPSLFQASMAAG